MEEQLLNDDDYHNVTVSDEPDAIDPKHIRNMQIINVSTFIVAIFFNSAGYEYFTP